MRQLLSGYAAALAVSTDVAGVVRDLETVAGALVRYEDLRSTLTDPGIPVTMRRTVLRELLEAKARAETVDLLSFAIRVERAGDLAIVIGQLIADLSQRPEQDLAGRSTGRERLRGYAERIFQELGGRGEVDAVEDDVFRFARILDEQPALRATLADPQLPLEMRLGVLDDLLSDKVGAPTLHLARYVLQSGQQRDLVGTFEWLATLAAEERGRRLAEVRSAVEIDEGERARLALALGRLVDRPVEVRVVNDPSVVGGALVTVGDLIIDGTVRMRLERLRDALASSS